MDDLIKWAEFTGRTMARTEANWKFKVAEAEAIGREMARHEHRMQKQAGRVGQALKWGKGMLGRLTGAGTAAPPATKLVTPLGQASVSGAAGAPQRLAQQSRLARTLMKRQGAPLATGQAAPSAATATAGEALARGEANVARGFSGKGVSPVAQPGSGGTRERLREVAQRRIKQRQAAEKVIKPAAQPKGQGVLKSLDKWRTADLNQKTLRSAGLAAGAAVPVAGAYYGYQQLKRPTVY